MSDQIRHYAAYAQSIAALARRREDEDMSESETAKVAGRLQKDDTWTEQVLDEMRRVLEKVEGPARTPNSGREAELERQYAEMKQLAGSLERQLADAQHNAESFRTQAESAGKAHAAALERIEEAEEAYRQLAESGNLRADELEQQLADETFRADGNAGRIAYLEQLLATAYVAREVPWSDVAAGMMTIARDGTPWMVENWDGGIPTITYRLRNGDKTFEKSVAPDSNETVRVLEPYVTPEQAEALVVSELGGRA